MNKPLVRTYRIDYLQIHELCLYVVDNVGVGHELVSVFWVMQLLPYGGIVENEHGSFGGDVEFFGKLHDDAGYLAV